ncbi:MAG: ASKHA domain-containing protein [Thermoleophilia bacterium]
MSLNPDNSSSRGPAGARFGMAVDVGTSSIWSRLTDLNSGEVLDTMVVPNPQKVHGADISSRLEHAAEDTGVRAHLHELVTATLSSSVEALCADAGIGVDSVEEVVAVGNSAMYAFIMDVDSAPLCGTPYNLKGAVDYYGPASGMGVAAPNASLFVPRPIFGFVGADALADILLIGMADSDDIELIVDVGTNCEMALGNREKILVASSPAGPAYEDTHMSFGISATEGAIYKAVLEGERFVVEVVGGGEARGICGSGLIDIIAEMRKHGWVDASGRLLKEGPILIADAEQPITVGQHDIRSFQLVKSSVHAAIAVLQHKLGIDALGRMLITGTFGSYIDLDNARILKMFPDLPNEQIEIVADAACQGAVLMLGEEHRRDTERLREKIRHVALPQNKSFQDEFVRLMGI